MYYGPRRVGVYDPIDTKSIQWNAGMAGYDKGKEMEKAHAQLDAQDAQGEQEDAQNRMMGMQQAAHERNLQAAEQQRRAYESETARRGMESQDRKYNLLSGLLR